jgi:hypothetical protein
MRSPRRVAVSRTLDELLPEPTHGFEHFSAVPGEATESVEPLLDG